MNDSNLQTNWHEYYSEKRITHQWRQVNLLKDLPVKNILEVGPYLGLVTAMLASAGYKVTTLDIDTKSHQVGATGHITADIRKIKYDQIDGFDAILCCETLEHIPWDEIDRILLVFAQTTAPYLLISVPYEGAQFAFELYFNRYYWRRRSHFKKGRLFKSFSEYHGTDWEPHKWEIGYKGRSLKDLKTKIKATGFRIEKTVFTSGCRSVFLLCRNTQ
tara:strand:- start:44 stop:694 length:651 start_codon:yes stop_codon:yes gene_type:complete